MAITYTRARADWKDDESGATPILGANLDTIEAGVEALYDVLTAEHDVLVASAASTLTRGPVEQTYTPVLTATSDPTLGTGATQSGAYFQMGNSITGHATIIFGTGAAAGSGAYLISAPVAIASKSLSALQLCVGHGFIVDSSATSHLLVSVYRAGATSFALIAEGAAVVSSSSPWTWADGDTIALRFNYATA